MNLSTAFEGTYGSLYYVYDMEKSVNYYKQMLNLTPGFESPTWTEFSLNGHNLCLHLVREGEKVSGKSILITKVKGLEEVVGTLKSRGVEFLEEIHEVCDGGFA